MMLLDRVISFFTSLRLTVVCLAMSLVLVFVGTLAQVNWGLYMVQERYFRSLFVFWGPAGADWKIPVWPGGYLLGGLLLINLIAAHIKRFEFSRKKLGLFLIHFGLILLLFGQLLTDLLSVESHLRLAEGETKNYSESDRLTELVVVDASDGERDRITAIPESVLARNKEIRPAQLPFAVRVREFFPNSRLRERASTNGAAMSRSALERYEVFPAALSVKMDERNMPSAIVEAVAPEGVIGSWLVSSFFEQPQRFVWQNKVFEISLRWERYYKPFSLTLLDFTHERYKGTDIPKNFSSRVRLRNAATAEDREVLIYMNNPLRYAGETYYQGGFERGDQVSILQVVRNPSWLTPYFACALVGIGLVVQFLSHLIVFLKRRMS